MHNYLWMHQMLTFWILVPMYAQTLPTAAMDAPYIDAPPAGQTKARVSHLDGNECSGCRRYRQRLLQLSLPNSIACLAGWWAAGPFLCIPSQACTNVCCQRVHNSTTSVLVPHSHINVCVSVKGKEKACNPVA